MAIKHLKKGELLFSEGDSSKAMYFVQYGTLRLFKRKNNSAIEIGMIHKGELVGEMGFLDGGPRSASAEAMYDCELVEISNTQLQEQLKVLPSWLMTLLKTIVNRLRSANTKIRQLETTSSQLTYGRDGATQVYTFLPQSDVMKLCLSILLIGSRSVRNETSPVKIKQTLIQRYAGQILNIHTNKIAAGLDVLEKVGILAIEKVQDSKGEKIEFLLKDIELLETFLHFMNEENLKEHSKKLTFSIKGIRVLELVVKHLEKYPADPDGISTINVAEILALEKPGNGGKDPFTLDEFAELVKNKVATELSIRDSSNVFSQVNATSIARLHKMQLICHEFDLVNSTKRRSVA